MSLRWRTITLRRGLWSLVAEWRYYTFLIKLSGLLAAVKDWTLRAWPKDSWRSKWMRELSVGLRPALANIQLNVGENLQVIELDLVALQDPIEVAHICHDIYGIWPISLSMPKVGWHASKRAEKSQLVSRIVPGDSYAFVDENSYNEEYARSWFAFTHRKGGWDCFRHLEILKAGSLPLMLDAPYIPKFTMTHYPKEWMIEVAKVCQRNFFLPGPVTLSKFEEHFDNSQTSESAFLYWTSLTSVDITRTLFLDESLPIYPDYLSISILVGLSRAHGARVWVPNPPAYLYSAGVGEQVSLYGRGFNYGNAIKETVPPLSRSSGNEILKDISEFDPTCVVIGSLGRNLALAKLVQQLGIPNVLFWGEDYPIPRAVRNGFRGRNTHVFAREVY